MWMKTNSISGLSAGLWAVAAPHAGSNHRSESGYVY